MMTILLAEDNADHAELTTFVLREVLPASRVVRVANGEALLAAAKTQVASGNAPELLVLDIKMPRMNGYEVLKALKGDASLRDLPVLIITTSADDRDRQACLALGAAGYLVKPVTAQALINCLERVNTGPCGPSRGMS